MSLQRTSRILLLIGLSALATAFSYSPPGVLEGAGEGRDDSFVYVPDMRFPIEAAPAYLNSQVWGHGGSAGPGGGQCDPENYSYPWFDNYCESRTWTMPMCPSGQGHQGQDIRPSTCANKTHWTVAAEDGTITNIGSYSVSLTTANGTRHRYLHMDPASLAVSTGQSVKKGQRLGLVSNAFGGTPTTIHLHYDIQQNISGLGTVYVPTYMSLVGSYERLIGVTGAACAVIPPEGGVLDESGPCFFPFGPSQYWRSITGEGNDNTLMWTNAFQNDNPSNWARWQFHFEEAGEYSLEIYATGQHAVYNNTRYGVRSSSGADSTHYIDQSAPQAWKTIGTFQFDAGGNQHIDLYDDVPVAVPAGQHITADAIRLTRLGVTPPVDSAASDTSPGLDAGAFADTFSTADTSGADTRGQVGDGGPIISRPDSSTGGQDFLSDGLVDAGNSDIPQVQGDCACRQLRPAGTHRGIPAGLALALLGLILLRRTST